MKLGVLFAEKHYINASVLIKLQHIFADCKFSAKNMIIFALSGFICTLCELNLSGRKKLHE